ncbi:MAG: U32 family peptidase [Lachnospiraceae bacterium]|nr:U32 family peptidase [Lachnospiraceae bacterium]
MNKKVELLIPAGDLATFKIAVRYGADAIYIGGESFSLRAKAKNFTIDDMKECIKLAHDKNIKVYITANIYAHNDDLEDAKEYFKILNDIKPDAVLISDLGLVAIARSIFDGVDIHISTQANTTNYETVKFYRDMGIKRVVLARELSLDEIKKIKDEVKDTVEIETFVHGAMCISYSGRCLLSAFMTGRSANEGECTHPCRWKYMLLEEEERKGEYMPVMETERGTYIFNSKDLNMIEHIDKLIEAGIDSLKIEGRMKTALYIATVARTYRKAIDDYYKDKNLYFANIEKYKEEIAKCTYREFTTGFYFGKPDESTQIYDNNTYVVGATYYGTVERVDNEFAYFEQKNKFSVGDELVVMKTDFSNLSVKVLEMYDETTGEKIESCPHSKQRLKVKFDKVLEELDIIRSNA